MAVSFLLLVLVLHAILLLSSDQHFFHASLANFQLEQLRENALTDIDRQIQEQTLADQGKFDYDIGTAAYKCNQSNGMLEVKITLFFGDEQETDKITYQMSDRNPVNWLERTDP